MPCSDFLTILQQINENIQDKVIEYIRKTGKPFLSIEEFRKFIDLENNKKHYSTNHKILNITQPFFLNIEVYSSMKETPIRLVWFNSLDSRNKNRLGELVELVPELTSTHRHDFFELTYVFEGQYTVMIEDDKLRFQKHEICLLDRNCEHQDMRDECSGVIVYLGIRREAIDNFLIHNLDKNEWQQFLAGNLSRKKQMSYINKHLTDSESEVLENYLAQIYLEMEREDKGYLQMIQIYIIRMLAELGKNRTSKVFVFDSRVRGDMLFLSVSEYMQSHMADVSLHQLSIEFHYQEDYYNRLIREHTGMTFSQYLRRLRLDKAASLLNLTDLSVKEISQDLGFSNESYFFRIFKEDTGMTPLEYRKYRK